MIDEPAVVRLCAPNDLIPFRILGPPADRGVIGEIQASGGTYEPQVMQALRALLPADAVVFDIGANIGVFAVVMARLAPRGKVFAFEPAPESYEYLVRNAEVNGATNIVAERTAVYDRTGSVEFVFSPDAPSGSFVAPGAGKAATATSEAVTAVRLDDYVAAQGLSRVDLVMVDAEGAELAVLRGAERTLAIRRPALLVEINPVSLRRFGGASFRELVTLLRRGRTLYSITDEGRPARILSDRHIEMLLRRDGVIDLLCLPRRHPARSSLAWLRGAQEMRLLESRNHSAEPPDNNFVVEPAFALSGPPEEISGYPNTSVVLNVTVHNTSPYWYSSDFRYHPVHVSYRWLDDAGTQVADVESHRGRFDVPLAPGRSTQVEWPIHLPSVPGSYHLALTMLQESFAWFDDLDPTLRTMLPGTVLG